MISWPSSPPTVHSGLLYDSSVANAARFAASIRFLLPKCPPTHQKNIDPALDLVYKASIPARIQQEQDLQVICYQCNNRSHTSL